MPPRKRAHQRRDRKRTHQSRDRKGAVPSGARNTNRGSESEQSLPTPLTEPAQPHEETCAICALSKSASPEYAHARLPCGLEFAANPIPGRNTVALAFRVLTGVVDDPPELTGLNGIVERTLSKGTQRYTGRQLADAFDALGARWSSACGRQTTLLRAVCLPEYTLAVVDLLAEMLVHPTFPDDACRVAVELSQQELRSLEDEPDDLLLIDLQRLTLGPVLGRNPGGEPETLGRITPDLVREHWRRLYAAGRLQVAAAGPLDLPMLTEYLEAKFAGWGDGAAAGRNGIPVNLQAARHHREKQTEQQYIGITLPGLPRTAAEFAVEQVLLHVLSGGMSGRLFTEVREKLGLVYWVGAWHEQPRGAGVIHLGASTTPERCDKTYETLLRELRRLSKDLTSVEVSRARNGLIAHYETEDDLTRARAGGLSDDLFHHGRPIGLAPKLAAIRAVTLEQVQAYARRLPLEQLCVATVGPRAL